MIEELDYDYRRHDTSEGDKNLAVRFYMDALKNEEKSVAEGRLVCDDVEFVEIRVRGDRNNIVQVPVNESHKKRFAELYRAFKSGEEGAVSGTPLVEWPSLPKSLVMELGYLGFRTVEQVAEASDSVCSKMAGLQSLKQRAKLWIEAAKTGSAPLDKLQGAIDAQNNEIEVLRRQVAQQAAVIGTLEKQAGVKAAPTAKV